MLARICALALAVTPLTSGALLRLDVQTTDVPDDPAFSRVGSYERLTGKAYFAVDRRLPANRIIRDIEQAPVNEKGFVEFSADVIIVRPRDLSRGNGAVLFEASNRGSKGNMGFFNRTAGRDGR